MRLFGDAPAQRVGAAPGPVELPQDASLERLAPEKTPLNIRQSMGQVRLGIDAGKDRTLRKTRAPRYAPAGQSTQMIVGADAATDADVLLRSEQLYGGYHLRRVYYSAFSPIPDSSSILPSQRPHLMREHRLYEADWLMRFYGFERTEIVSATEDGMLDPAIDPKLAWALKNRDRFPIDVNLADREMLLRIPGLGVKSVDKLVAVRRLKRLTVEDLVRVGGAFRRMKPFVTTHDWRPTALLDTADLPDRMRELSKHAQPKQLELF